MSVVFRAGRVADVMLVVLLAFVWLTGLIMVVLVLGWVLVVFLGGVVACGVVWLLMVPVSERYELEISWLCGGLKLILLPSMVP